MEKDAQENDYQRQHVVHTDNGTSRFLIRHSATAFPALSLYANHVYTSRSSLTDGERTHQLARMSVIC